MLYAKRKYILHNFMLTVAYSKMKTTFFFFLNQSTSITISNQYNFSPKLVFIPFVLTTPFWNVSTDFCPVLTLQQLCMRATNIL